MITPPLLLDQLLATVTDMRENQRKFFSTRQQIYLQRSKALEKQVDALIEQIRTGKIPKQTTLL